ncbi:hypothetical protein [Streptomyces sp. NPDC012825]|uniref:hypothetical protein n=1 Tax=Streptomyces sp. NPDC012825 TaxID=3364851 RepID=UPI0036A64A4B
MGVWNWLRAAAVTAIAMTGLTVVAPPASAATRLGGINLSAYCQKTVNPGDASIARLVENHARGWRCVDSMWMGAPFGWATYNVRGMDLDHACRLQYGGGAYKVLEQNHAQGWACYR